MTELYWPTTGNPMGHSEWARLLHGIESAGVIGSPGDTTLEAYFTVGVGLFLRPGSAVLAGLYTNDAVKQITVPNNGGGVARKDLLVLRQNMASPGPALATYVVGGISEPAPQYDPAGIVDVPIAGTSVPAGSVVPSSIADRRTFAPADVIPCRTVADIPASRRRTGTVAVELPGRMRVWTGAVWDTAVMTSTHGPRFYETKRLPLGGSDQYTPGSFALLLSGSQAFRAGDWDMRVATTLAVTGVTASAGTLRVLWSGVNLSSDERADVTTIADNKTFNYPFTVTADLGSTAWSVQHQVNSGNGLVINTGTRVCFTYLGPRI